MLINNRPRFFNLKIIKKVEEMKNAKYVCEVAASAGANEPAALFYTATPHPVSNSHYFILFDKGEDNYYVASGAQQAAKTYTGVVDMDEVFYSVHRHDCYQTPSGYFVDGGDAYFRVIGNADGFPEYAKMKIVDGVLTVLNGETDNG